jgi:AcrR family transcriptional regulator
MTMSAPQRRRSNDTSPPGRLRTDERKRELLAHAKQLFATNGFQETTTERIAHAAGISESVLYRHFSTKKAVFLEVLAEVRQATVGRWLNDGEKVLDPLARLHLIMDAYLGATKEQAAEFRIMHRALLETSDEEIMALVRDFYLESEEQLARIIAEGQQSGVFRRNLDPRVGAWELIRTALGYTLTLPLAVPLYQEPDYLPRAIECLLNCLLKTDV